jgi:hypothetical protein
MPSRGGAWAALAPRHVQLKRDGKVTAEAVCWFNTNIIL